jgi:AbrB family looped-hinge helix DNA binding protein
MRHEPSFTVHLGDRGRLVLPAQIRERLGLRAGDTLLATLDEDGTVRMASLRENARQVRGLVKQKARGRSLSGELVAERRRENPDA